MEANPLELALQQLAKTMGVNLPGGEQPVKTEQNIQKPAAAEAANVVSEEEGELLEEPDPFVNRKRGQLEGSDPSVNRKRDQRRSPRKSAPTFTGEVDAESLLRGPKTPKMKRPRVDKVVRQEKKERPKVPCRYWMEGKCSKGDECTFSHASRPNRSVEDAKSEDVCRFHIAGNCLKGDNCMYSHDLSKVPCKFFHVKGDCGAGASCRFSHGAISEQERHLLFVEMMGTRDPRLPQSNAPARPISPPPSRPAVTIAVLTRNPTMILDPEVQKYNPFGSPF
ncbi:hypothetical protein PSACC_02640 [Paramicrosporidium saccamoebae]|uniref:C3H1-type domain-containing protein n=1 Tax=Paramicrosporidium saccamoebae TaxID=1246581 RepID=A0A2H9TIF7_9FUNG|nr:hypothetical protein PSACC_02640 [Paramicrosporidium saccamoebae]